MQRVFNLAHLTRNRHCTCTHPLATSRPWLRCTPRVWFGLTARGPRSEPLGLGWSVRGTPTRTRARLIPPWNPDLTPLTGWPFRGTPTRQRKQAGPSVGTPRPVLVDRLALPWNPDLTTAELLRPRSPTQPSPIRGLETAYVLLYCEPNRGNHSEWRLPDRVA